MSKFKKIEREFLASDSSLNTYSYRLLTSGYQADLFQKNPIGFRMHKRDEGVVLKWEDIRIDGDKILATPVINLSHPKGAQTVDEVENGFLNAASMGSIVALEISSDPADYLPGQKGPTISKWYNRELSLVDIPGNYNATANLVDANDNPLNLADFKIENLFMEKITLTPAQLAQIPNLKADANQGQLDVALQDLISKAAKADTLTTELATAKAETATAEKKLTDLSAATATKEVADLVAGGVDAKKITPQTGEQLKTQYAGKPADLKALIDGMPAYQGVVANLNQGGKTAEAFKDKSWDDLDQSGQLPDLLAADETMFFDKFTAKYNTKHVNDKR